MFSKKDFYFLSNKPNYPSVTKTVKNLYLFLWMKNILSTLYLLGVPNSPHGYQIFHNMNQGITLTGLAILIGPPSRVCKRWEEKIQWKLY